MIGTVDLQAPRWVVLQLLEKCNLRCRMCYEWGEAGSYHEKKKIAQLDPAVVKKVITDCAPYRPYFGLFGGEPLLYPWVDEVLATVRFYDCNIDIPTNGTLLETQAEMLVATRPTRLWISLDGPPEINDRQRGAGVYRKITNGIRKLYDLRQEKKQVYPKIGVTLIVTPLNHLHLEQFFLEHLELRLLDHISIEFQNFATLDQHCEYAKFLQDHFGIPAAPSAAGIVADPEIFQEMNVPELVRQLVRIREYCEQQGVYLIIYPKTVTVSNIRSLLTANWEEMTDYKRRCPFPWLYAEVGADGNVTTCHTFYDLTHGSVYEQGILEIWNSPSLGRFRQLLRKGLLPICTACSRYYSDPNKK